MNESQSNSYFLRHRTSIIIVIVAILVVAGVLIWAATNRNQTNGGHELTEAERQAIIKSTSGTGTPPYLSPKEEKAIIDSTSATGSSETSSISDQERQDLINSMSGN